MKHFTISELTRSATAKRLGISNTPTKEDKEYPLIAIKASACMM